MSFILELSVADILLRMNRPRGRPRAPVSTRPSPPAKPPAPKADPWAICSRVTLTYPQRCRCCGGVVVVVGGEFVKWRNVRTGATLLKRGTTFTPLPHEAEMMGEVEVQQCADCINRWPARAMWFNTEPTQLALLSEQAQGG